MSGPILNAQIGGRKSVAPASGTPAYLGTFTVVDASNSAAITAGNETTVLDVVGQGCIDFLASKVANFADTPITKLIVDGVETTFTQPGVNAGYYPLIDPRDSQVYGSPKIDFKQSLKLISDNTGQTGSHTLYYRYFLA